MSATDREARLAAWNASDEGEAARAAWGAAAMTGSFVNNINWRMPSYLRVAAARDADRAARDAYYAARDAYLAKTTTPETP